MDDFKYNVELEEIKAATLLGFLKKKVVFHSHRAHNCCTPNDYQYCSIASDLSLEVQHYSLYRASYDRLKELKWDTAKLPMVHQSTTAAINVFMTLLEAHTITRLFRKSFDFDKALKEL